MSSSSCRVCLKNFKEKESRLNMYKKKAESSSLAERFNSIGVTGIFEKGNGKSSSICRPCESKLSTVEKADKIRNEWSIGKAQDVIIPEKKVSILINQ